MFVTPDQAVKLLKNEGIAAIPTETVYGLAAIISSDLALRKIFETKQRPFFDPLIVHVEDTTQAQSLTTEWPAIAEVLTKKFWPGPLTLVLKKNDRISDVITSGLERVGIRCPSHPVAQEILRKVKIPLAAPSANLFGRTSPTSAQHVEKEFQGHIPVVDGGSSDIGIESTVLLVDGNEIAILRSGHVLAKDIERCLQTSQISFSWKNILDKKEAPGHMKHHYMPAKPLFWIDSARSEISTQQLSSALNNLPREVEGVKIIKPKHIHSIAELSLPPLATEAARLLYSELRRLAEGPSDCLVFYFRDYMNEPEWEPVLERLRKASSAFIKN
jgi:L-threonylcarbamoyladenylate synthase